MSVALRTGRTAEELVDCILTANEPSRQHEMLIADLCAEFGLSIQDAELSVDRVRGGVIRAQTGSHANCPNRIEDPIAWTSFQRVIAKQQKTAAKS